MENDQLQSSEWVENFAARLPHLRDDDAKTFADNGAVKYSTRPLNVEVEDLQVCGLTMRRYKYKSIDCFARNPYKNSAQAKRYDRLTSQAANKRPSSNLVKWMMAKILLEHNGKLGGRVTELMKTAYVKASKTLRDCRSKWPAMEQELRRDVENQDLKVWWDQTKVKAINRYKDHFRQCDRDAVAAADPTILEMVTD